MAAPMSAFPSFFKVIHDQEQKEETRIPKFIAINYWEGLSNPIFLRLPNVREWRMFWEKRDDGIWLHKNWKNFAELNSLRFGSLLLFDYTGKSHFQVRIFNPDTSECKYDDSEGSHHEQVEKRSESAVILEESETNSIGPSKRTKNYGKKKIKVDFDDATQQEVSGANRGIMAKASCSKPEAIIEITSNFESEIGNPFCVVILTRSSIHQLLGMPSDFSRKHLYGLHGNATIGVGEDLTSTWDVSFTFDYTRNRTRLGNGWRRFCQDNNLQVGDACIFELLKRDPVTFKVHVSIKL